MSDVEGVSATQDNGSTANLVYILYLVALLGGGITAFIGVIMAYVYRGSAPAWLQSHCEFQIRTFWYSLLAMIVAGVVVHLFSAVLPFAMIIAVIVGPAFVVWWIVRCVKGMQYVGRREAYSNYDTLFW